MSNVGEPVKDASSYALSLPLLPIERRNPKILFCLRNVKKKKEKTFSKLFCGIAQFNCVLFSLDHVLFVIVDL